MEDDLPICIEQCVCRGSVKISIEQGIERAGERKGMRERGLFVALPPRPLPAFSVARLKWGGGAGT